MKKKTKLEKAAERYAGIVTSTLHDPKKCLAFKAGAAWAFRQSVKAVSKIQLNHGPGILDYAPLEPEEVQSNAIEAIRKAGK